MPFQRHFSSEERKQSGWMLSWKNSRVNMSVNSDLAWMIPSQRKEVTHKTFLLEAFRFHLINCSKVSFKLEVCQGRPSCFWNSYCCQVLLSLLEKPAPKYISAKILEGIKIMQKYSIFLMKNISMKRRREGSRGKQVLFWSFQTWMPWNKAVCPAGSKAAEHWSWFASWTI